MKQASPQPAPASLRSRRIGVLGLGTVGSAIARRAEAVGLSVFRYDPSLGASGSHHELDACGYIFVCVPTPFDRQSGLLNVDLVFESVATVGASQCAVVVSTLNPDTYSRLRAAHPELDLVYVPEFLRAAHADDDFASPARVLVSSDRADVGSEVIGLYRLFAPSAPILLVSPAVAEVTKLASNAFLAVKVTFANELFDLCEQAGIDWRDVASCLSLDPRIGPSHFDVTETRTFDGACLPKDTRALHGWSRLRSSEVTLLAAVLAHKERAASKAQARETETHSVSD